MVSDYTQFESVNFDLFMLDRNTDSHAIIARRMGYNGFDVSSSGQYVVFSSNYFQPSATFELSSEEVFLYDRINNTYTQVGPGSDPKVNDAGMVVFTSRVDLLPSDTNELSDVYLFDSSDNSLNLVSTNTAGVASPAGGSRPFISDSATEIWVGFTSFGNDIINNDINNHGDVFMYNWPSGSTLRVSQQTNGIGGDEWSGISFETQISAEGEFVVFSSRARNLTNDNYTNTASNQIFIYQRTTQAISVISPNFVGSPANDEQSMGTFDVSDSGRYVSYTAFGELDDFDAYNSDGDVFLYDQQTQQTTLVSQGGNNSFSTNGRSANPQVVEDLTLSPPLVGVIFDGAAVLTEIDNHSGHTESFLYQQSGPNVELTIEVVGTGTVSGSFGVNCMTTCDSNYPLGIELNLLAIPDAGFVFDRWSSNRNNCNETQNCTVNMDRAKTIQAIFIDENDLIFRDGFE